jgi:hypothetical protein
MMAGIVVAEGGLVVVIVMIFLARLYSSIVICCVILAEPLRGSWLLLVGSGLYVPDFLYPCLGYFHCRALILNIVIDI